MFVWTKRSKTATIKTIFRLADVFNIHWWNRVEIFDLIIILVFTWYTEWMIWIFKKAIFKTKHTYLFELARWQSLGRKQMHWSCSIPDSWSSYVSNLCWLFTNMYHFLFCSAVFVLLIFFENNTCLFALYKHKYVFLFSLSTLVRFSVGFIIKWFLTERRAESMEWPFLMFPDWFNVCRLARKILMLWMIDHIFCQCLCVIDVIRSIAPVF